MILIDSNVPMYLVGAEHSNKEVTRRLLETAVSRGDRLVTDAEVLREILHRYVAIDRRPAIQPVFDAILGVVEEVLDVKLADVQREAGRPRRLRLVGPGCPAHRDHAAARHRDDHELRCEIRSLPRTDPSALSHVGGRISDHGRGAVVAASCRSGTNRVPSPV